MKYKIIDKVVGEILESTHAGAMFTELTTRRQQYFKSGYYINIKIEKEYKTRIFIIDKK